METLMRFAPIPVAAIAAMAVGFIWYSPMLFARAWTLAMGYDPGDKAQMAEMQKTAGPLYAASFLATLITAAVLWAFARQLDMRTAMQGMQLGIWCWAGFIAPVQFTDAIFGKRGRKLLMINAGYQLATMLVMGAIIGAWAPR
jgi:hypothetical protein